VVLGGVLFAGTSFSATYVEVPTMTKVPVGYAVLLSHVTGCDQRETARDKKAKGNNFIIKKLPKTPEM